MFSQYGVISDHPNMVNITSSWLNLNGACKEIDYKLIDNSIKFNISILSVFFQFYDSSLLLSKIRIDTFLFYNETYNSSKTFKLMNLKGTTYNVNVNSIFNQTA